MSTPQEAASPAEPKPQFSRAAVVFAEGALVLMAVIWGVNFSVVKFGTDQMSALAFNGARMALAAGALVMLAFVPRPKPISRRDMWMLLLLGVLGNGVYQLLFIQGVAITRAGDAALMVAVSPALIAIAGRLFGIERVTARGTIGIALSIFGVGFVVYSGTRVVAQGASVTGDLLVLAGSVAWAAYTVLLTPYTRRIDDMTLSAYTMIGGAIAIELYALPEMLRVHWSALPGLAWGAILYSGIGSLVIAYLFWYRGVRVIGPTRSAMYSNLQPIIALVVAWLLLGETLTPWQGVGAACIMAGLLLTRA